MSPLPSVDVNLFVYNSEATVGAAIDSVLGQSYPAINLTLIDDGSTDGTPAVLDGYAARHPALRRCRNRVNTGAVASFQRAFWHGDADFVLPKSGDDVLAPDFVARTMDVLLAHPDCAMCHAGGLVFTGQGDVRAVYPDDHRLQAVGPDPLARVRHVMRRYTSAPSFWGVYRRAVSDRLTSIRYRAGWDHALLAELSLYGEIRHVAEPLYWRHGGGRPVRILARAATEQGSRGLSPDGAFADQRWRVPLITTAYAHIESFAAAAVPERLRHAAIEAVAPTFRDRWLPNLLREAADFRAALPGLVGALDRADPAFGWRREALRQVAAAVDAIVPHAAAAEARRDHDARAFA